MAYIPYHGNEQYVDSEFFRCVRARYYILNAVDVSRLTLQSFLEGKEQWGDKKHLPVRISDDLLHTTRSLLRVSLSGHPRAHLRWRSTATILRHEQSSLGRTEHSHTSSIDPV